MSLKWEKFLNKKLNSRFFTNFLRAIVSIMVIGTLAVLPKFNLSNYSLHLIIFTFLYITMAVAWNIVGGMAGQLSFGHVAYFGIGAYMSHLLFNFFGVPPLIGGVIIGGTFASLFSLLIGYPCFRLKGPFYALSTLAFAEILKVLATHFRDITGGMASLSPNNYMRGILFLQFKGKKEYYYIFLCFMLIAIFVSYSVKRAKFGYRLTAIRENQDVALSLGINVIKNKLLAGAISAWLVGTAGALYANYCWVIDPHIAFGAEKSILMVIHTLVGGAGTTLGPIIGAGIFTPLGFLLTSTIGTKGFPGIQLVILGALFIVVILTCPQGLMGLAEKIYARRPLREKKGKAEVE